MSPAASDTPPEPLPARRIQSGEHSAPPSLYDLLEAFMREVRGNFRDMRLENANASRDTQQRLAGIEGRLADGTQAISKHDMQLEAVIAEGADHHRRLDALERQGGSGLARRIDALEAKDEEREKAEASAKAVAEAAAKSPVKRLLDSLLDGAARSLGPIVVAFLTWLVLTYARMPSPPVAPPGVHP